MMDGMIRASDPDLSERVPGSSPGGGSKHKPLEVVAFL